MYSRQQASLIQQEFWTTFGQYMAPVPSADEGVQVNWINYRTGFKDVYFKMRTHPKSIRIGIFITHNDAELQELFFEQFLINKTFLESILQEKWEWSLAVPDDNGKTVSIIYTEKQGLSIFNRDHWPEIISFFKNRMIALDEFWSMAKYSFNFLK